MKSAAMGLPTTCARLRRMRGPLQTFCIGVGDAEKVQQICKDANEYFLQKCDRYSVLKKYPDEIVDYGEASLLGSKSCKGRGVTTLRFSV